MIVNVQKPCNFLKPKKPMKPQVESKVKCGLCGKKVRGKDHLKHCKGAK